MKYGRYMVSHGWEWLKIEANEKISGRPLSNSRRERAAYDDDDDNDDENIRLINKNSIRI